MNHPARCHSGFTLIELLIVMSILGILAAIVVPKFTAASDPALVASTRSTLTNTRKVITLYKLDHGDTYPTLAELQDNWSVLMGHTDRDGNPVAEADADADSFGPYLRMPPTNPYTNAQTVVAPGSESAKDGFTYDETTGAFHAVGFDEDTDTFTAPGE